MTEPQTLEEAWDRVYEFTECAAWHKDSCLGHDTALADARDAARAVAQAAHKAVCLKCFENTGDCAGRSRIEELGR